jgi:hypothetical protein
VFESGRLVLAAAVACASCAAASAWAASAISGTWVGTAVPAAGVKVWNDIPVCSAGQSVGCISRDELARRKYRFTFVGTRADYYGVGPTSASHDPVETVGWCRMRWNRKRTRGGWTFYRAAGKEQWTRTGAGPAIECQEGPVKDTVWTFRVRQSGARLTLQFAEDTYVKGVPLRYETPVFLTRA